MLFDYQVYGLSLCADRAIPGLTCRPAKAANSWFIRVSALSDETDDSEATEPDCLYVSDRRCEARAPFIDCLPATRALIELVGNSYASHLLDGRQRAQEFKQLVRLARAVALRRLTPSSAAGCLARLCRAVIDDVQSLTSSAPALQSDAPS